MEPIINVVYSIQYVTRSFTLDLQENIYTEVLKIHYMSAGEAGRHVVGVLDLCIDDFLEIQKRKHT